MPRPTRVTVDRPNSVIASAAQLTDAKMNRPSSAGATKWQEEAWYFFDQIGEFRYGCSWKAAACSKARLTITEETPDGDITLTDGPEVDALNILFGGDSGQSQMLAQTSLHMNVPGESYIVGEPDADTIEDTWKIYSNDEITRQQQSGGWVIDRGDEKRPLSPDAAVIRLWRSHPRKWVEADSPARGVLPVLRRIEQLGKHLDASVDSRLAGAGILLLPNEMSVPPIPDEPDADPVIWMLTQAMTAAMTDRASAAAVVPIVLRLPGELIDKVKHITFSTPFDEKTEELHTQQIRRLASGMDLPAEVMLGLGTVNHWGSWQIEESAIKTHIEPDLETITSGLTQRWLQPAVKALGGVVHPMRRINFDTSDLRMRPDHSDDAVLLYDRMELNGDALRRETGFDEGDRPDDAELRRMLLVKLAQSNTPEVTVQALAQLGVTIDLPDQVAPGTSDGNAAPPGGSVPQIAPAGDRALPEAASAAVLACAELLVTRAVERANNRMNNRGKHRRPIHPDQLELALVDAWTQAPRVAGMLGVDPDWFIGSLDRYTRAVLTEGTPHEPRVLSRVLAVTDG